MLVEPELLPERLKDLCKLAEHKHSMKMFSVVTETWNPVTGCLHHCRYCWARRLAETKLKNSKRYSNGFVPRLNREEFGKKFNGGVVFVSDMKSEGEAPEDVKNHPTSSASDMALFALTPLSNNHN